MPLKFSIVTNVCASDDIRIVPVVKSWIRVFGGQIEKIMVVIDCEPPSGRIAKLHGNMKIFGNLKASLATLKELDARVDFVELKSLKENNMTLGGWFIDDKIPHRCQAGTPIFPFIYAMACLQDKIVLRVDCDMIFYDSGIIQRASEALFERGYDLVEPYRWNSVHNTSLSTRAFLFSPAGFKRSCLPLRHLRLGFFRSLHRILKGLPTEMALEQTLEKERSSGKIRHLILGKEDGWSLHVGRRSDFLIPEIEKIISQIEKGQLPTGQELTKGNFDPSLWVEN